MVGIAFARLYYVWIIRKFYRSLEDGEESYGSARGRTYGYAPVHSSSGGAAYSSHTSHAHEDSDDYP